MDDPPSVWKRFSEVKRYVRFEDDDAALLLELLGHARPELTTIAKQFYERAREHEEAHAVFRDEAQIKRLQSSLVLWMERVMTGPYDEAYCEKSARIGAMHVEVGLPQRYMIAAMSLFRLALSEIALRAMAEHGASAVRALHRVLDLELALMVDTYADAYIARISKSDTKMMPKGLRRYVDAVELAPSLVVGIDAAGTIQLMNKAAQRLTGYAADEAQGRPLVELCIAEGEVEVFNGAFEAVKAAPPTRSVRVPIGCTIRSRSGRERDMRGHITRAPASDDDEFIYFVVGRDVTEEVALNARLRRSEKLAAVGTLAAGLAHEIRNPLNGAQLHLTYMRRALRGDAEPDVVEAIDVVSDEVKRLSNLVTDFLDFARPRELHRQATVMQELCRRCVTLVRALSDELSVQLDVELPETDIVAQVDQAMIEQVLLNLLNNAVQASGDVGGGLVVLRAYRRPRAVVVEIHDDGSGLQDSEAPIFDAFYSTKDKGTGLGLSIVHRIVTDHYGEVNVASEPGSTTFQVVLPLVDPEQPPLSIRPQSDNPA